MSDDATPPAYRITTPRAVLRCWEPADAPAQVAAITVSLPHLRPWLPWAQVQPTFATQLAYVRHCRASFDRDEDYAYGVFAPSGELLGGAGLHKQPGPGALEIGFWIHAEHARRGFGREVAAALTCVAFEVERIERVELRIAPGNLPSTRIAKHLGFEKEATLRRRLRIGDDLTDVVLWVLFASEYDRSAMSNAAGAIAAFDVVERRLL